VFDHLEAFDSTDVFWLFWSTVIPLALSHTFG
jgi:hypothetical protein